jgi:hypothetical protein|tara:strand:+ start:176 stop:439 length:264 start_codon:yes stop_codon:yes gene_type:complete
MSNEYNKLLKDSSGNSCYIYIFNSENWLESEPLYGISGEHYNIKYDISGIPFIGYTSNLNLYNKTGDVVNLPGINSRSNISKYINLS